MPTRYYKSRHRILPPFDIIKCDENDIMINVWTKFQPDKTFQESDGSKGWKNKNIHKWFNRQENKEWKIKRISQKAAFLELL